MITVMARRENFIMIILTMEILIFDNGNNNYANSLLLSLLI